MIITNAKIFSEKHVFEEKELCIRGERIAAERPEEGEVFDASGLYAVPAFVDIHLHGAAGADFSDGTGEAAGRVLRYEASRGVLAVCPATMTGPKEDILKCLRSLRDRVEEDGADVIGVNLEGPFVNPEKCGAQDPEYAVPFSMELFNEFQEAAGCMIRLLDLAPECMDSIEDINVLSESLRLSLAHTECDYETAKRAFSLGADHLTHSWNAMPGIGHRDPGPVIAAAESRAYAEIIADGIHLHPAVVRLAFRIFGEDRTVLVSDSMRATGMGDGSYELGGQKVRVKDGKAVLAEDPSVIAGSVTDLYGCFKKAVAMGVPLEAAVRGVSENPAASVGVEKDYGTLAPGAYANILLLDDELELKAVIKKGRILKDTTKR